MAMETYGIINIGSASKKYALYRGEAKLVYAHFEHEADGFACGIEMGGKEERTVIDRAAYEHALSYMLALPSVVAALAGEKIIALGVRVVAPGTYFQEHRMLDVEYLGRLLKAAAIAPLHIQYLVGELGHIHEALPQVPIYAISDSAFHRDLPARARSYAIPHMDATRHDLYRFGYHGLSVGSVVSVLTTPTGLPPRMIVCHLGSGGSITALARGKSVDTSMGFTPDEGIPMATRVGTIDVGAAMFLAEKLGGLPQAVDYFNHKSGILGVSGSSADIRELLAKEKAGDEHARAALELYVYHIQKQIGAYVAALGGLDALIFTGTIGERSAPIRTRVCAGLVFLGVRLDAVVNDTCYESDATLHSADSQVAVVALRTREMDEIARLTQQIQHLK